MPETKMLTFAEFQEHLARLTHLDPASLTGETNLVLDLGLDSLKLLEIVLEFDRLGVPVSLKNAWGIQTVGEAYAYYKKALSGQTESGETG